jgi:uncharacterized protein YdeI (YjbR/CyaY-like superfamily)
MTSLATGMPSDEVPELIVPDASAWRDWLAGHHAEPRGVWLVLSRKATTTPTRLSYGEALEEALSYGWIDSQARPRDEATYRQRFTPRRRRSPWSKRNTLIAERLIGEGRMQPAGMAEIERARADGRWQAAYPGSAAIEVPGDLAAALDAEPAAKAAFALLSSANRYAVLYRVQQAKRPETRLRRIEQFVAMLGRGETVHAQRRPLSGLMAEGRVLPPEADGLARSSAPTLS